MQNVAAQVASGTLVVLCGTRRGRGAGDERDRGEDHQGAQRAREPGRARGHGPQVRGARSYHSVMDGRVRMAPLTWVAGAFRARVLAARLESEGIDAQLRGALESPYGLTVGDMARVDVYVPEDQLADARYVLLADEIDDTLTAPSDWWNAGTERATHTGAPRDRAAVDRRCVARDRAARRCARRRSPLVDGDADAPRRQSVASRMAMSSPPLMRRNARRDRVRSRNATSSWSAVRTVSGPARTAAPSRIAAAESSSVL